MTKVSLAREALALRALKEAEKKLKDRYDDAKAKRERAEIALMQRMEGEGAESIKAAGTLFSPTKTVYGQVNDRAAFVKWAEENDIGLLEMKERKGLIHELARQRLDDGEEFPPGMTFYVKEYISQRAA